MIVLHIEVLEIAREVGNRRFKGDRQLLARLFVG